MIKSIYILGYIMHMEEESEYTIRRVTIDDVDELAQGFVEAFNEMGPDTPWDLDHAKAYMLYWLEQVPNLFFGVFDGDTPIAAQAVNIKPWRTGVRTNDGFMFVKKENRKNGIGSKLFRHVLIEARDTYGATEHEEITFAAGGFQKTWMDSLGMTVDTGAILMEGKIDKILYNLDEKQNRKNR